MLSADQKSRFDCQGYLLVEAVLDPEISLDPIVDEYTALLDALVNDLLAKGELSQAHAGLDFGARLTKVYAETGRTVPILFNTYALSHRRRCCLRSNTEAVLLGRHRGIRMPRSFRRTLVRTCSPFGCRSTMLRLRWAV